MKRLDLAAAILGAAACLVAGGAARAAGPARRSLEAGLALLGAERFEEAAAKFEEAERQAAAEGLVPAVARYDRGIALLQAGKGAAAAAVFGDLRDASDAHLRESAHYHRGIALATAADAAEDGGRPAQAIALLEEALAAYESAMLIDPEDEDPKVNHELAARKKARLEKELQGRQPESRPAPQRPSERESRPQPPEEPPARQAPPPGEMRPDEARTLLDAMRQMEQSQRGRTLPARGTPAPVEKDW